MIEEEEYGKNNTKPGAAELSQRIVIIIRGKPYGNAIPMYFPSSSQNRTSHGLPPAGWKAPATGKVLGCAVLKRPQYAIADVATIVIGIP